MERMGDEKLEKRTDAQKAEIKRKRNSAILRWENYVKRHGKNEKTLENKYNR